MIAYDRLSQIIPADWALANKALSVSLQQLTGIQNMTLPVLANTVANLQTTNNLPLISALIEAVPANVALYLENLAGSNGAPVAVCDVLGIAAGYKVADYFNNTVSTLANTNVAYLTTIYQNMNSVVGNVYGDPVMGPVTIPTGQPAAGVYYADVQTSNVGNTGNTITTLIATAADVAFTGATDPGSDNPPPTGPGLLTVAVPAVGNVVANNPAQVANLNSYFNSMANQVSTEQAYQTKAQIDFANLIPNNNLVVYSLIYDLPTYGQQQQQGGQAQFWEGVANQSTFTGQAVVAVLREGHNQSYLNNAGISTNGPVPADANPPIPPANLISATYTASQAANIVIS